MMCLCEDLLWNQYTENFEEPFHLKVPGFVSRIKKKKVFDILLPRIVLVLYFWNTYYLGVTPLDCTDCLITSASFFICLSFYFTFLCWGGRDISSFHQLYLPKLLLTHFAILFFFYCFLNLLFRLFRILVR